MKIQNSSQGNFKAVRFSPEPAKWNQQVLASVLRSNYIKNIIKEDAKNNKDTYIAFAKHYDPAYNDYTRYNYMFLNVQGNNKDFTLGTKSTYRLDSSTFFNKPKETKTGPDDLGKDLSKIVDTLDSKIPKKRTKYYTLQDVEKIGNGLIYEKGRDYEEFKNRPSIY